MSLINPFDSFMIFRKLTAFLRFSATSLELRFTQPNFIKRRSMVNKQFIRDELIIMEIHVLISAKEAIANIINQDIIASAEHDF